MTISSVITDKPFTANGSTTQFQFPNKIFSATDLVVLLTDLVGNLYPFVNGFNAATGLSYTVTNVDVDTGALVIFSAAPTNGWQVDIRSLIPEIQSTSVKNQGQFLPELHEEAFDRATRMIQDLLRLTYTYGIHATDVETIPWPALPSPSSRKGLTLLFDPVQGLPTVGIPTTQTLTQALIGMLLNPQTPAEILATVTPTNQQYLELDPLRYGAVGDGVTDDSAAMNKWAAVINAYTKPCSSVFTSGKVFLCSPITTITTNDVTIDMKGSWIRVKSNSWSASANHLNVTGQRLRLINGTLDGNQANFTIAPTVGACQLLGSPGNNFRLASMAFINAPGRGVNLDTVAYGLITDCHFDSNANLGAEFGTASYLKFVNCTFNFNGNNYQGSFNIQGPAGGAFGIALRYRSHHITFTNCEAQQNGRDGFNVNQGSYAIKFIASLAWMNNDGGFTLAADQTSTGRLGEAESPYDIEYVDCEAYNNWSSGLAAYAPVYNVTVDGGRFYDNNRLAGFQAFASSYFSGLYFAAGSEGIKVRTKAYDDRQLCPVTGNAAGVIAATGWVAGSATNYPKVALYNAALAFQGYGVITAESAGSVTVATTTANGVTVASIAAGWFITQRVQHNGCFLDNNCQGTLEIDGFGFLIGPAGGGYSGFKTCSGGNAGGQNVLVPNYQLDPNAELLLNPSFDAGVANWTFTQGGSGGAMNAYNTAGTLLRSAGAMQLVGGTGGSTATGTGLATNALDAGLGAFLEVSVWCYAVNAGDAAILFFWNGGSEVVHPGGGWKLLKIGAFMTPATANQVTLQLSSSANKTNYFDNASIRVRFDATDERDFTYPTRNLGV